MQGADVPTDAPTEVPTVVPTNANQVSWYLKPYVITKLGPLFLDTLSLMHPIGMPKVCATSSASGLGDRDPRLLSAGYPRNQAAVEHD